MSSLAQLNEVVGITSTVDYHQTTFQNGGITKNNKHISVHVRVTTKNALAANSQTALIKDFPLPKAGVFFGVTVQGSSTQNFGWIDTNGIFTFYTYTALPANSYLMLNVGYDIA